MSKHFWPIKKFKRWVTLENSLHSFIRHSRVMPLEDNKKHLHSQSSNFQSKVYQSMIDELNKINII